MPRSRCDKRFVYVLATQPDDPDPHVYVGGASDVARRLETHNRGGSIHTAPLRPWRLAVSIEFPIEGRRLKSEQYLKSGAGLAFARRHLL